jgi:hypothetical protein
MIMKTHSFLLLAFFSILLWSCDGMYDNVNTYYSEGETNYIAKADSVSTKAGHNRVQITRKVNTDPRIKNLNVTWDDGAKEITVPIEFSSLDENRFCTVVIDPVEEGEHIFKLYHTGNGDKSIPTEAEANSYGARYEASQAPRPIRSVTLTNGKVTIEWRSVVENCNVEITYTNAAGGTSKLSVSPTDLSTVIGDAQPGGSYSYASTYLPEEGAIDTFVIESGPKVFPE